MNLLLLQKTPELISYFLKTYIKPLQPGFPHIGSKGFYNYQLKKWKKVDLIPSGMIFSFP